MMTSKMNEHDILHSMYIIPALRYLQEVNPVEPSAIAVLEYFGVDHTDPYWEQMKYLVSYHYKVLTTEHAEAPYHTLRAGLEKYARYYIGNLWLEVGIENYINTGNPRLLDYACGSGEYTKQWLERYSSVQPLMVDNAAPEEPVEGAGFWLVDLLMENWELDYIDSFDVCLMSEILHCKQPNQRLDMQGQAHKVLKKGGLWVVVEQSDPTLWYRLRRQTTGGSVITPAHMKTFVDERIFKPVKQQTVGFWHNVFIYEAI